MSAPEQFIRINSFIKLMGWSRSTFYNRVRDGAIPKPETNGPRTKGYYASTVSEMQRSFAQKQ